MPQHLLVDDTRPFYRITLNRPRSGNLVSPRMMLALQEHVAGVAGLGAYKAVVLRGAGKDFCLGREPKPAPGGRTDTAHHAHASVMSVILGVYKAFRECPVPVVAAVQGRAHGFGCGVAGACDLVIASDDASFALPEMAKGIPPTLVMCALADVNRKALVDMVYSCRELDAVTAQAVGIASRVVPAAALDDTVDELLASLAGYDLHAIRYIKGFSGKPGHLDPQSLSDLAGYTLDTAYTRPRDRSP
jgi:enoyl-CoA hydratase